MLRRTSQREVGTRRILLVDWAAISLISNIVPFGSCQVPPDHDQPMKLAGNEMENHEIELLGKTLIAESVETVIR